MSLLRSEPNVGSVAQGYNIKQIALLPNNRKLIHRRIDIRFRRMMEAGFEAEVRALFQRGDLHADLPAIRSVGYRQIWQYLQGQCSLDEAVEKGIIATRQLAKRQITWLRNWPSSCEIQVDNETELLSINNICQLALKKLPVAPIYSRNMES